MEMENNRKNSVPPESYAMKDRDGPQSYARNYYHQGVLETAQGIIHKSNTFLASQALLEAAEFKLKSRLNSPEFQVFYNDLVSNSFNTLFSSVPPERQYYVAGVPGSFHRILFPESSLHFVYSSFSLQWLSNVPKPVTDRSSPAWNRERIHYFGAQNELFDEYSKKVAEGSFFFDPDNLTQKVLVVILKHKAE